MLVTLQDFKIKYFLIVSCECPHRLSDKLLKSVATLSFDINRLGRCREVAYNTLSSSRVKLFFRLFFSESLAAFVMPFGLSPLGLPSHFVSAHRRSVEAHYRESENSSKCFFKKTFQLLIYHPKRLFFDIFNRFRQFCNAFYD